MFNFDYYFILQILIIVMKYIFFYFNLFICINIYNFINNYLMKMFKTY